MKVQCPNCEATLQAKESLTGKSVNCPRCQKPFTLEPMPESLEELTDFVDDEDDDELPAVDTKRKRAAAADRITCPMCGAKNRATAEECDGCGEPLSPGASKSTRGVWRDGKKLVMKKTATLPYRCIKTNGEAETFIKRKLTWHHPAVFLAIFCNLLVYVIVALVVSKRATVELPVCQRIRNRRTYALIATAIVVVGGLGVMVGGFALAGSPDPFWKDAGPIAAVGGILSALFGAIICLMIANIVTPAKITDEYVWLNGVHRDYLEPLPEWPGE